MSKLITLSALLACVAFFDLDFAYGQSPEDRHAPAAEKTVKKSVVEPAAKAEDVQLLKGLIVTGTLKQTIGTFNSHGWLEVGDKFEIDLDNLPKEKLKLTPLRTGNSPYIPFSAPMVITKVKQAGKATASRQTAIELSADDASGKFHIRVIAEGLEKGSAVRVYFFMDRGASFIGSMAEAEGVLK